MQKAKWLSEEALQVAVKRREAKGKEERENYIHLNAEFQRIASRGKKAFLRFLDRRHSDWCEVVPHCGFDLHFSNNDPVCKTGKKTQMCRADFWTQRERERVG